MMELEMEDRGVQARGRFREILAAVAGPGGEEQVRATARLIVREPFAKRSWSELAFLAIGVPLAGLGAAFVIVTLFAGVALAITFFGLGIVGLSVVGARGIGGWHRQLARAYLGEEIENPEPFAPRRGFFGWVESGPRDRTRGGAMGSFGLKVPLATAGILVGFAFWWDAFFCLTYPVWGGSGSSPAVFGLPQV